MDRLVFSLSGYAETAAKVSCKPVSVFNYLFNRKRRKIPAKKCAKIFMEFPDRGLCTKETDTWPLEEYFLHLHKANPNQQIEN